MMENRAMEIEKIDITNCSIEDRRKLLAGYEAKLSGAKAQRDKILLDVRRATAASDAGDQRQRFALGELNRNSAAAGRLILSLEAQVAEARKRLEMAEAQAAAVEAKSHAAVAIPGAGEARWFETSTPDNRLVRHRAASLDALRKALLLNYTVTAEVFGASDQGLGGFVASIGPGAKSTMSGLLAAHGDELLAWLAGHGVGPTAACKEVGQ
jgi:hypothetical protein